MNTGLDLSLQELDDLIHFRGRTHNRRKDKACCARGSVLKDDPTIGRRCVGRIAVTIEMHENVFDAFRESSVGEQSMHNVRVETR